MSPRTPRRTWFLTYPQTDIVSCESLLNYLSDLPDSLLEYLIAEELHKDGNLHLHAYVKFQNGVCLSDAPTVFTFTSKSGNYQPTRSPQAVIAYCSKGGNYLTNIDVKSYLSKKGKKVLSIETIKSKTVKQALEDGDIGIHSLRNYQLARSIVVEPYEHSECRGIWIYGPPGTGKSHTARLISKSPYLKQQNKWFDGYAGEHDIILDDLDTPALGHHLKIWSDKYACTGEVKGGQVQLTHRTFIVTSNYHPTKLFLDKDGNPDEVMCAAIIRRFKFYYFGSIGDSIEKPGIDPEIEEPSGTSKTSYFPEDRYDY